MSTLTSTHQSLLSHYHHHSRIPRSQQLLRAVALFLTKPVCKRSTTRRASRGWSRTTFFSWFRRPKSANTLLSPPQSWVKRTRRGSASERSYLVRSSKAVAATTSWCKRGSSRLTLTTTIHYSSNHSHSCHFRTRHRPESVSQTLTRVRGRTMVFYSLITQWKYSSTLARRVHSMLHNRVKSWGHLKLISTLLRITTVCKTVKGWWFLTWRNSLRISLGTIKSRRITAAIRRNSHFLLCNQAKLRRQALNNHHREVYLHMLLLWTTLWSKRILLQFNKRKKKNFPGLVVIKNLHNRIGYKARAMRAISILSITSIRRVFPLIPCMSMDHPLQLLITSDIQVQH